MGMIICTIICVATIASPGDILKMKTSAWDLTWDVVAEALEERLDDDAMREVYNSRCNGTAELSIDPFYDDFSRVYGRFQMDNGDVLVVRFTRRTTGEWELTRWVREHAT